MDFRKPTDYAPSWNTATPKARLHNINHMRVHGDRVPGVTADGGHLPDSMNPRGTVHGGVFLHHGRLQCGQLCRPQRRPEIRHPVHQLPVPAGGTERPPSPARPPPSSGAGPPARFRRRSSTSRAAAGHRDLYHVLCGGMTKSTWGQAQVLFYLSVKRTAGMLAAGCIPSKKMPARLKRVSLLLQKRRGHADRRVPQGGKQLESHRPGGQDRPLPSLASPETVMMTSLVRLVPCLVS